MFRAILVMVRRCDHAEKNDQIEGKTKPYGFLSVMSQPWHIRHILIDRTMEKKYVLALKLLYFFPSAEIIDSKKYKKEKPPPGEIAKRGLQIQKAERRRPPPKKELHYGGWFTNST